MPRPPSSRGGVVVGRGPPGEGEEDLVEAGQVQGELGDRDAGGGEPRDALGQRRVVGDRHREHALADLVGRRAGRRPRTGSPRSGPSCAGSAGPDLQGLAADHPLEPFGGVVRDDPAVVDHRDRVGERVGLLQVLGGEQHRRAVGDQRADHVPHVLALGRVEPGGRLVQEDHVGGADQAGGQVEPPAHAAGVGLGLPVRGVGQVEPVEQLGGPLAGRRRGPGPAGCRRAPGSAGRSGPRRPRRTGRSGRCIWRTRSASRTTSKPLIRAVPASGVSSVERMRTAVVLPAPLGPSTPSTVPRGTARSTPCSAFVCPKCLDEALGLDHQVSCHAPSLRGPADTAPTRHRHRLTRADIGAAREGRPGLRIPAGGRRHDMLATAERLPAPDVVAHA